LSISIGSKALIKAAAVACTAFQAYALWAGQPFSPLAYCSAIATLFGGNAIHENFQAYTSRRVDTIVSKGITE